MHPTKYISNPGSSSFITDAAGLAEQHIQYLPFGELFVSQRNGSFDSRYKFTAKEQDNETNYTYFGARYYDSDISIWLSVDKLCDKAPGWSPYHYAFYNPVKLVDPDGNWPWEAKNVREARSLGRKVGVKPDIWTGQDGNKWASIDYRTATNYTRKPHEVGGALAKVFSPEGKSWGESFRGFIKKIDDGGGADGANTGRITGQDVTVGLGVIGALSGIGVLTEGVALGVGIVVSLGILNNVDDIGTNPQGESILQQTIKNEMINNTIDYTKGGISLLNIGISGSQPKELIKSIYKISNAATDGVSTGKNLKKIITKSTLENE